LIERTFESPPRPRDPRKCTERTEPIGRAPANYPAVQRRGQRDENRHRRGKFPITREQKSAGRENKKMRDRKRGRLLRERQRKFPDQNDDGVYKNRKRSVLEFAGQITANPRVWAQERQMMFAPTPRDVGEHRQDRYFVVVVPKKERIVPKQNQAEGNDN